MNNDIWRAYALAIWPTLIGQSRRVEVRDASGRLIYNRHGQPETEWKEYDLDEAWLMTVKYASRFCDEEAARENNKYACDGEVARPQTKKEEFE